jgi:hypothetical protein
MALAALAPRLDAAAAARAWDGVAEAMSDSKEGNVLESTASSLAALAQRLDGPRAAKASDELVSAVGKIGAATAQFRALAALAARLDGPAAAKLSDTILRLVENEDVYHRVRAHQADTWALFEAFSCLEPARTAVLTLSEKTGAAEQQACRMRVANVAVVWLTRLRDSRKLEDDNRDFCFVIDQFDSVIEQSMAGGKFTFDDIGSFDQSEPRSWTNYKVSMSLFAATTDLATTADCLRHPDCVGDTRQRVLHRLEELAFPPPAADARQAIVESVVTGLTQPLAGGVLAAARQAKWERERKFRTTWDAVAWLNKHHPEIDLDKPYTPRK